MIEWYKWLSEYREASTELAPSHRPHRPASRQGLTAAFSLGNPHAAWRCAQRMPKFKVAATENLKQKRSAWGIPILNKKPTNKPSAGYEVEYLPRIGAPHSARPMSSRTPRSE